MIRTRVAAPENACQMVGLTTTTKVCINDARVVAIDTEKIKNKRKYNARMRTSLAI